MGNNIPRKISLVFLIISFVASACLAGEYGESCTSSSDCSGEFQECDFTSNTCRCIDEETDTWYTGTRCAVKIGKKCDFGGQKCSDGASCAAYMCKCGAYQKSDEKREKCLGLYNGPCYSTADCEPNNNLECDVKKSICKCIKEGAETRFNANTRKCEPLAKEYCTSGSAEKDSGKSSCDHKHNEL